jgi:hypothetical protein
MTPILATVLTLSDHASCLATECVANYRLDIAKGVSSKG